MSADGKLIEVQRDLNGRVEVLIDGVVRGRYSSQERALFGLGRAILAIDKQNEELIKVRALLKRWWQDADAGALDGVDLDLMVACDEYLAEFEEKEEGHAQAQKE